MKKKRHNRGYQKATPRSSLKLGIGELLLFGNKQQEEFWPLFEALLVQLYQGISQNPHEAGYMAVEWTIS